MEDARSFEELRRESRQRSASLGPLVAIAGLLRSYFEVAEELRGVIAELPSELESLDARLRLVYGPRWSDDLYEALRRGLADDRDERS
jgi:hypothetical protein